jgi:hypothetical protein
MNMRSKNRSVYGLWILLLVMLIAFAPAHVHAQAGKYDIWVGGIQVTDENAHDVLGDGSVSYDPENKILRLEDANIVNNKKITPDGMYTGVYAAVNGLHIEVYGRNKISVMASNDDDFHKIAGIHLKSEYAIINGMGDGSLDVHPHSHRVTFGIFVEGNAEGNLIIENIQLQVDLKTKDSAFDRQTSNKAGISAKNVKMYDSDIRIETGNIERTAEKGDQSNIGIVGRAEIHSGRLKINVGECWKPTYDKMYSYSQYFSALLKIHPGAEFLWETGEDLKPAWDYMNHEFSYTEDAIVEVSESYLGDEWEEFEGTAEDLGNEMRDFQRGKIYYNSSDVPGYPLSIAGMRVTDSNKDDILGNGTVVYNPATNTLTLDNADIRRTLPDWEDTSVLYTAMQYWGDEDLNVVLRGENSIEAKNDHKSSYAIVSFKGIKLRGEDGATLQINAPGGSSFGGYGIEARGTLQVNDLDLHINAKTTGIFAYGDIVLDGGEHTISATDGIGLKTLANLQMKNNPKVDIRGKTRAAESSNNGTFTYTDASKAEVLTATDYDGEL